MVTEKWLVMTADSEHFIFLKDQYSFMYQDWLQANILLLQVPLRYYWICRERKPAVLEKCERTDGADEIASAQISTKSG
jgi:hypothetical protein